MKRIFLILLGSIVVLGLFGAAGYAGYCFGYAQGIQATANGDSIRPGIRPFDEFHRRGMPHFGMDREFQRRLGPGRFPITRFGFFSPLRWLAPLVVLVLLGLFLFWLFARSGWRLTHQTTETVPPTQTEPLPPRPENE